MATPNNSIARYSLVSLIWILAVTGISAQAFGEAQEGANYQQATTAAYNELARNFPAAKSTDLSQLTQLTASASTDKQKIGSVLTITGNIDLIKSNPNAPEIRQIIHALLRSHAVDKVTEIIESISADASAYTLAGCNFELIKYEASFNEWDSVLKRLKAIDIPNDLPKSDIDEANIIFGSALQHDKQHRKALEYYQRVKADSKYYAIAQLNTGLVYIRQDWWTDAQIAIEHAKKAAESNDLELVNRLYTTLGFSQLQQGFYRNARESFRKVKIDSAYASRALLGIGTAALNQEDYIGAINAFDKLKTRDNKDMSVAQSFLLSAYTLSKIKQNKSAVVSYSDAINFYERKFNLYASVIDDIVAQNKVSQQELTTRIRDLNTESEVTKLIEELSIIGVLLSENLSPAIHHSLTAAYSTTYQNLLTQAKKQFLQKQTIFDSYLNQSRFGLTRLYDAQ